MCRCLRRSCPSVDGLNQRARRRDFDSRWMSVMAILQPPYFRNYTVRRLLPRKWRLVLFAMAFLSVPFHPSAAEPIKRNFVMCRPEHSLPNRFFPRSVLFSPSPQPSFIGMQSIFVEYPKKLKLHAAGIVSDLGDNAGAITKDVVTYCRDWPSTYLVARRPLTVLREPPTNPEFLI
jgi:hypothetical protein